MIKMRNVSKVYKGDSYETIALESIDLSIDSGELVSVMGESGSGKTTLLNIMGFLDTATDGYYYFNGEDVSHITKQKLWKHRRNHIGFVFQNFALIDTLTVKENIMVPLDALGVSSKKKKERVYNVLESFHMRNLEHKYPPQISGGQRQRVAIARAIVTDPDVILADEPTGALDHQTGMEVMKLLRDLHEEGRTIVIVTHDAYIAKQTERIIRLKEGRVI